MIFIKSAKQLIQPNPKKEPIHCTLIPLAQHKGFIFSFIRFLGKSTEEKNQLTQWINEQLMRFQDTLRDEVHTARRFEQLLQVLNEDITHFCQDHAHIPIDDIHAVVGIVYKSQIFLSSVGNTYVLFMHRTAQQRYLIYELSDELAVNEPASWKKLFTTVLDGEFRPGDVLYIANRVSAREITLAELQDTLTTLPASGSLKRIGQHLHHDTAYGALCFQAAKQEKTGAPKKQNPMHSMRQLDETQEKTASLLDDQAPDVGKFLTKITTPLIKKLSTPGTRGYKSLAKRMAKVVLQITTITLAWTIKLLSFCIRYAIIGIQKFPGLWNKSKHIVKKQKPPQEHIQSIIHQYKNLETYKKYAIGATTIFIIIALGLITIRGRYQAKQEQAELFVSLTEHIDEKLQSAQASLIYDNKDQATQQLQEASTLLLTLEPETRSQKQTVEDLQALVEETLFEIQKVIPIEIQILAYEENLGLFHAFSLNDTLYGISQNNEIYHLQSLQSAWNTVDISIGAIGAIKQLTIAENGTILIIDEDQQLGVISIDQKTAKPIISGVNDILSAEDIIEYNESIYVLSAVGEQIMKMRERGDGYEAGTPWINATNADTDLSKARAMAIDGNIYILTESNVLSFLSGREQSFALDSISPALHDPIDIWTDAENDFIYILEPVESRILVIDKQGALIAQYTNDAIKQAHSMIIDELNNTITIVTQNAAYSFTAEHLLQ